jgi:SOS response associated peptidase (SRAP)
MVTYLNDTTGEPNEFVREIHTRMPVILPEEYHDVWLSGEAGKEVLVPYPADRMKAWPVSARVNSPKNNDAEIIAPIELNTGRDLVSDPRVGTLLCWKKTQAAPLPLAFFLAVIRKPKLNTLRKAPRPTNSSSN